MTKRPSTPDTWDSFPSLRDDPVTLRLLGILDSQLPPHYGFQNAGDAEEALAQALTQASRARTRARTHPETALATSWEILASKSASLGPWFLCDRLTHARHNLSRLLQSSPDLLADDIAAKRLGQRIAQCCETVLFASPINPKLPPLFLIAFCNSRLCPVCAIRFSIARAKAAIRVCSPISRSGHLTHAVFTIPNVHSEDLHRSLRSLKRAFHRLMGAGGGGQTKPLAPFDVVRGWIYSIEITYSNRRGDFHPHIHALFDSPYIPHNTASIAWSKVCSSFGFRSSSWHVSLSRVTPSNDVLESAVVESCKYALKPLKEIRCNHPYRSYAGVITATKSLRIVESHGTLALPPLHTPHTSIYNPPTSLRRTLKDSHGTAREAVIKSLLLQSDTAARVALKHFTLLELAPGRSQFKLQNMRRRVDADHGLCT